MKDEIYKGYLIQPVFIYSDGKIDFQVYPDEGKEQGWIEPRTTIERVKDYIDELESKL